MDVDIIMPSYFGNAIFALAELKQNGDTLQILRGKFDDKGRFQQHLTLGASTEKLLVQSEYVGLPDGFEIEVEGNSALLDVASMFSRGNAAKTYSAAGKSAKKDPYTVGDFTFLDTHDAQGVPANLTIPDQIEQDFLFDLNAALPDRFNVAEANPNIITGAQTNIVLENNADVWITFIGESAGYKNALGYYTYQVGQAPATVNDIDHKIIFPNTSNIGSGGGLAPGDKVFLGNFSAGTVISWFIVANGWDNRTGVLSQSNQRYYSQSDFNPEVDGSKRDHMVLLHDESRDIMVLGFEDLNREVNSDDDFNDVLFYTEVDPFELDLSSVTKLDKYKDTDGDGIIDALDDFINDPNYAFIQNAPAGDTNGEIGFEDLWPFRGDDDFNDLVMNYDYDIVLNGDNKVTRLIAYYGVENIGGSFRNGFAFRLPIDAGLISGVSGQLLNSGVFDMNPNGTESGTAPGEAVIPVVEDALQQEGEQFTITVDFTTPQNLADLGRFLSIHLW